MQMFQPGQKKLTKEAAGLPTSRKAVSKFLDQPTFSRSGQQLGNSENVDIVLKNFFDLQLPVGASQLIGLPVLKMTRPWFPGIPDICLLVVHVRMFCLGSHQ